MRTYYKLKFGLPNYPLTQSSLLERKMMNCYFFRRVTSCFIASLFALSVGVGSVKSVRAEDTKRLEFCRKNKSLFHLDEKAERKVKVAVLDFQSSKFVLKRPGRQQTSPIEITGLGSVLESKLVKDGKLDVIKWNQINPRDNTYQLPTNQLQKLRQIRENNGVEAVIIVTVMQFETTETYNGGWLITSTKDNQKIDIQLNLQVIDTTTGKIILEAQGNGSQKGNTLTQVNLPFNVEISRSDSGIYQDKKWNRNSGNYSISFKLGSNAKSTPVYSKTSSITEKLVAEATEIAMEQIKDKLNQRIQSEELPCLLRKPTLVAWVSKDKAQVILNKGKSHGYCKGMIFSIERSPKAVTDPATGRVISMETEKVGEVKLRRVDAESSVGEIVIPESKNGQSFQRMDIARITSDSTSKCSQDEARNSLSTNSQRINSSEFLRRQQQQRFTPPR